MTGADRKFNKYDEVPLKTILQCFVDFCCKHADCGIYDSSFGNNKEKIIEEYIESIFPIYPQLEISSKRANKLPPHVRFQKEMVGELNALICSLKIVRWKLKETQGKIKKLHEYNHIEILINRYKSLESCLSEARKIIPEE